MTAKKRTKKRLHEKKFETIWLILNIGFTFFMLYVNNPYMACLFAGFSGLWLGEVLNDD